METPIGPETGPIGILLSLEFGPRKAESEMGLRLEVESETEVELKTMELVVEGLLIGRMDQPLKKPPLEQSPRQRAERPWARLGKIP